MGEMADVFKLVLSQLNPKVGAIRENAALVRRARRAAADRGAHIVVTGELVISGYPPEDLVCRPAFLDSVEQVVLNLAAETEDGGPALLVGAPWRIEGCLYNAALLVDQGRVCDIALKHHIPNYGVFDEVRTFHAASKVAPLNVRGVQCGVMICEDMWQPDVASNLARAGAEILIVLNGSPWQPGKREHRHELAADRAKTAGLPLVYVNQIGGQDELVFDGSSFVLGSRGDVLLQMDSWCEGVADVTWTSQVTGGKKHLSYEGEPSVLQSDHDLEDMYQALVVGLRDYVTKNCFPGVLVGLSGGIDSALSAAIAVDALGPQAVWCVMLPSVYTSEQSLCDAQAVVDLLGCRFDHIDITPMVSAWELTLRPFFKDRPADVTEENVQSRVRGTILMALSNKFGHMVLSTGNKSEMCTGYATLYGDMCGGYSVLKDVYKTRVVQLSRWRNAQSVRGALGPSGTVIPQTIIDKPPSAELRPEQKDEDNLPPYSVLDVILECLVEGQKSVSEAVHEAGVPRPIVEHVWTLLNRAEYKRRQAPPGVKVTSMALGRERRYPITHGFTGAV